jgi:hypothetical protein
MRTIKKTSPTITAWFGSYKFGRRCGCAIAFPQPLQRSDRCPLSSLDGLTCERCLIFAVELRRAKYRSDANPRAVSAAHVTHGSAVAARLLVQIPRAWSRHDRMTSRSSSGTACCRATGGLFDNTTIVASGRTLTASAPTCFAARMARATSARVTMAGRRDISITVENKAFSLQTSAASPGASVEHGGMACQNRWVNSLLRIGLAWVPRDRRR